MITIIIIISSSSSSSSSIITISIIIITDWGRGPVSPRCGARLQRVARRARRDVRLWYTAEMYTPPPINVYGVYLKWCMQYSKLLVYMYKY